MLRQVTDGVWVHTSSFLQTNSVVVAGPDGALVVDPGLTSRELSCLAGDVGRMGSSVAAGFSTHPHWDHLLWSAELGAPPRLGTAACAASVREQQADPDWRAREAEELPPEIAGEVPLDLLGAITGLPAGTAQLPWDGPTVQILEHRGHAPGHAALLVADARVLVAGDMLSDTLIPFLDSSAEDPVEDYLLALQRFEALADAVEAVVPGHGAVGRGKALRERIDLDRAYVEAVRDGREPDDPRLAPAAPHGEWLPDVHAWQREAMTRRGQEVIR